ncbi:MAG: AI-2E family transporter [Clostridia bacterium]|nr:AI-2E family transporter [Clostridia bacterium]
MKLDRKTLLGVGGGIFLLFLAIYYWSDISGFLALFRSALTPLVIGTVLAYFVNLLMCFYEARYFPKKRRNPIVKKTRRPVCMIGAFLTMIVIVAAIVGLVLPQLATCVVTLVQKAPAAVDVLVEYTHLDEWLPDTLTTAIEKIDWPSTIQKVLDALKDGIGGAMGSITAAVSSVFSGVVTGLFALIFAIYLLLGKDKILAQGSRLMDCYLPEKWVKKLRHLSGVLNECFHKYIVGQCLEAVILGVLCMLGMLIFGFPYATMIGALVGLTALIPVAGAYIGAGVGAFMILSVSPQKAVLFLVYIIVLQQLEGNVIYPRVVGTSIGLPGIIVLAAVTVGGTLFGFVGMLIGVPIAAAVFRLVREDLERREALDEAKRQAEEA